MGNYEQLKQSVSDVIKTNGNQEITGSILQNVLLTIISTVGANATFAGIATPSTNPGTPDGPVFYIASESGTYSNFGGAELQDGLSVLMWNGSWSSQQILSIDDVPTAGSDNLVKSKGVQEELALGAVYDVSAKNPTAGVNNDGKFESLSALLEDANLNTLIPTSVRRGGMSIKFIQSSDNKYVQYRLMADDWSTTVSDWQGVDDEPIEGSENLIGSGAVAEVCGHNMELGDSSLLEVVTDHDGKMIEAIKKDGTKVFYGGIESPTIDDLREYVDKIEEECGGNIQSHNSEFVDVVIDSEDKMIEATKKDGKKIFYGGIESPTIDDLKIELNKLNKRNLSSYCTGSGSENDAFVSSDGTAGLNNIKNTITDGGSIYLPKGKYAISAPANIYGTSILIEGESMSYTEGALNAMVGLKGSRLSLTDEDAHLDFNVMGSEISRLGIFGVKADDYNVSYKDIFDINNIDKNCGILARGHFDQCKINKVCLSMLACGIVCKGTVNNKAMLDASIFDNINFDGCYNGLWVDADTSNWNGYMRISNCIFADMFGMPMYVPVSYAWFITNNTVMNAGGYITNDIISLTGNPTMFYINGSSNRIINNHFYGCGQTNDAMIGGTWGEYEKIEGCYALISTGRRNTISDNTVVHAGNGFLIKDSFSIISQNNFEEIDSVPLEITGNNNLISNNQIISYNENSIIIRGNNNTIVSNVCNGKIVLYGNNNKVINNNAIDIVDNGTGNVIV